MNPKFYKIIYWLPRILCILFIVFISMFAMDVFGEKLGFWKTLLALAMHLIPSFFMIIILILAWRWEWIGGIKFIGLAIFYIVWSWGKFDWMAYVFISGTASVVGALFFIGWFYKKKQ